MAMVHLEPLPEVASGRQQSDTESHLPDADGKIIRAKDAALIFDGEARLKAANAKSEAVLEAAKIRYQREVKRGYDEGRQAGEESVAKLLNDTLTHCEQYLANREADLVDLVLTATQSVLESFDDRALAEKMLKKALKERRAMRGLSLHVHPSSQDGFVAALNEIRAEIGHVDEMISVSADVGLEPGMCVLDTPLGYVQLGIEAQLNALRNGLIAAFDAYPVINARENVEDAARENAVA